MSLINKMLQDLDARGGDRGNAGQAVRSVTLGEPSQRKALAAGAGVAVVALAAAGWFGWKAMHKAPAAKPPAGATASPGQPGRETGAGVSAVQGAPQTAGGSAINEASVAQAAVNAAAEASRAGRAARIEAGRTREARAQDAADLAAQLADAKRKAREARAQAAALAAGGHGAGATAHGPAQGAAHEPAQGAGRVAATVATPSAQARQPAPRLAAKAVPVREPEAAGVTMTSQQQSENAYKRALAALQEGRVPDAMANLEQAVYAYPRNDAARQALVGLLLEARRNDEAIRQLQLGLGLDPKQQQMAMLLARLQIEKGGPAVETLLRTLPYAGNNPDYLAFLAGALQKAQRHREAVEQYQAALRLMPQNGVWWMGMGISLQADKRNAEAVEAYQRAKASGSLSPELASFVERKLAQLGR